MKVFSITFWVLIFFGASLAQAGDKAPGDLSVSYEFVQGGPARSATTEKYTIQGKQLTLVTDYIPTEYGSDVSKRTQDTKKFNLNDEKLAELWQVIQSQGFMTWPASEAQRPPQSGNQTVTITAQGKTATHSMWESAVKDRFTDFSREFLQWTRRMMTVEFLWRRRGGVLTRARSQQ